MLDYLPTRSTRESKLKTVRRLISYSTDIHLPNFSQCSKPINTSVASVKKLLLIELSTSRKFKKVTLGNKNDSILNYFMTWKWKEKL